MTIPGPNDPQILDPQSSEPWSEVYLAKAAEFKPPPTSEWRCKLASNIFWHPVKGEESNWFHRWMQRLAFGFKWEKTNGS